MEPTEYPWAKRPRIKALPETSRGSRYATIRLGAVLKQDADANLVLIPDPTKELKNLPLNVLQRIVEFAVQSDRPILVIRRPAYRTYFPKQLSRNYNYDKGKQKWVIPLRSTALALPQTCRKFWAFSEIYYNVTEFDFCNTESAKKFLQEFPERLGSIKHVRWQANTSVEGLSKLMSLESVKFYSPLDEVGYDPNMRQWFLNVSTWHPNLRDTNWIFDIDHLLPGKRGVIADQTWHDRVGVFVKQQLEVQSVDHDGLHGPNLLEALNSINLPVSGMTPYRQEMFQAWKLRILAVALYDQRRGHTFADGRSCDAIFKVIAGFAVDWFAKEFKAEVRRYGWNRLVPQEYRSRQWKDLLEPIASILPELDIGQRRVSTQIPQQTFGTGLARYRFDSSSVANADPMEYNPYSDYLLRPTHLAERGLIADRQPSAFYRPAPYSTAYVPNANGQPTAPFGNRLRPMSLGEGSAYNPICLSDGLGNEDPLAPRGPTPAPVNDGDGSANDPICLSDE